MTTTVSRIVIHRRATSTFAAIVVLLATNGEISMAQRPAGIEPASGATVTATLPAGYPADWAARMFKEKTHDFANVARHAKTQFAFVFQNPYPQPVHVAGVRTSCQCTRAEIKPATVEPGGRGTIVATIGTDESHGQWAADVTVIFDRPFQAEVQLYVVANILDQIAVRPDSVQFGTVLQGAAAETEMEVIRRPLGGVELRGVRPDGAYLTVEPLGQQMEAGQAVDRFRVRLGPGAPVGYLTEHLFLVTGDAELGEIAVPVEGRVQPAVTASPQVLLLGDVASDRRVRREIVVHGAKPFRVKAVHCDDSRFHFDLSAAGTPKTVHVVPLQFAAGDHTGEVKQVVRIETDLTGSSPEITVRATVVAR